MGELYVCFNDSVSDPTYNSAQDAFLVVPNSNSYEDMNGNPCSPKNVYRKVPLIPDTAKECSDFAALMGWEMVIENGEISFRTGIPYP